MDIVELAANASEHAGGVLHLPPGRHDVYPEALQEAYRFVSNNNSGLKRILFNLEGIDGLEINGHGAEIVMHGRAVPFSLLDSRNITIRNLSIDWGRKLMSPGRVPEKFPVAVEGGRLVFHGDRYYSGHFGTALEYCADKLESAYKARDNYGWAKSYERAELIGNGKVRVVGERLHPPKVGNWLNIKHEDRFSPGIAIDGCTNVRIEDVNIYHCSAMGVIAQCSRDLYLERVDVKLREGVTTPASVAADATHFVDCDGKIRIIDCLFENQQDDPCNIHGVFRPVIDRLGPDTVHVASRHYQQVGVRSFRVGDRVGFYDTRTLELVFESEARAVDRLGPERTVLATADTIPDFERGTLAVLRKQHDVDVLIRGCTFRRNRARGLLISTLGKVLIEDNHFHVPGAAVKISGDAGSWYESGPVEDVEIRNNTFDNCNYGVWGRALFDIDPEIEPGHRTAAFHRNVRIHHNRIKAFHKPHVYARCIDGLVFRDNEIVESGDYPPSGEGEPATVFDGAVTGEDVTL